MHDVGATLTHPFAGDLRDGHDTQVWGPVAPTHRGNMKFKLLSATICNVAIP
jgi:hypothetical protein